MRRVSGQLCTALRAHLDGARARPPEAGILLWNAFASLSAARSWHAHGPNPISSAEIAAWCSLMRLPLEPRHVEILREMDQVWLASTMQAASKSPGSMLPPRSSMQLTPALFDAMMG